MKRIGLGWAFFMLFATVSGAILPAVVHAEDAAVAAAAPVVATPPAPPAVNGADTAWVLISAALVLLMTPALAFFYGGLVRRKNMLSILMQCFMAMAIITVQWVVIGYTLAFGPDKGGWIGGLDWMFLKGVGLDPSTSYATTIPHQLFMVFQMMFAIITPALIIGAFAERMKFSAYCIFIALWATLVYSPVCHWVWGVGGFILKMGALDFAGGTVVHINAGVAALAAALVLGKRVGYPNKMSPPHNLPFAVMGAGLLWFGWFGFNGGSAVSSGSLAASAFVVTHIAAAVAALTWVVLDLIFNKHMTMLGMITGAVAGLVAITPASGFVDPMGAIFIGVTVSLVCYVFVAMIKPKLGYDDSLDAFGVHGVGGFWGAVATGLAATKTVNGAGADGLFYGGGAGLVITQIKAAGITAIYSFVVSFIIFKLIDLAIGLRVKEQDERIGLDLTQHSEAAYTTLE